MSNRRYAIRTAHGFCLTAAKMFTVKYGLLLPGACVLLSLSCAPQKSARVVSEGLPAAVIILPDNAHQGEKYAAGELREYLEKISGARLEIVPESLDTGTELTRIFIGETKAAAEPVARLRGRDADAFIVEASASATVYLTGASPRATVYAVYDFLERDLGCRWLGPGELWEEIPRSTCIEIRQTARMEEPGIRYRADYALGHYDWALKQKVNVARTLQWQLDWMHERYSETEPLPIAVRGWSGVHGGPPILRATGQQYAEWFALAGSGDRSAASMCFSNPETHEALAERLSQLLRERPELDFVELGCVDGLPNRYCRCDRCMEWDVLGSEERENRMARGRHTHRWLALVNAVAGRLAESDPGKFLLAGAYSSYQEPPAPDVITPADNVIICYWTWDGCRLHGYEHGLDDETAGHEDHRLETHEKHREWMESWSAATPAGIMVSEYLQRNSMDGMTGANPRRYISDMRYIRDRGAVGYTAFMGPLAWGINTINRYAVAKAAWDPGLDADELVRDFCEHAFHGAAEPMLAAIAAMEAAMKSARCSRGMAIGWMTPEAIMEVRRHLDAAHAKAVGNEIVERRLSEWERHFRYSELAGPAFRLMFSAMSEKDPERLREAIEMGEAALAYRDEMREKYPDDPFRAGWRMSRSIARGGTWRELLKEYEKSSK